MGLSLLLLTLLTDVPYSNHRDVLVWKDDAGVDRPVTNPAEWSIRRQHILRGFQEAAGPLPAPLPMLPLDLQVKEELVGDGYRRQSISIQVEPSDRVTAYLYLPTDLQPGGPRRPAMLVLHPTHALGKESVDGRAGRPNRASAKELAKRGYVVIAPDYPSFGELKDYRFDQDQYVSGTMKGIVNHRRCVDLLQSLPTVDPDRIGVLGHSLGGHNSIFIAVFDERIRVIVSSCGWCPFHDYYAGKLTGWTSDRYLPRIKTDYGLDPDRVPFDFYELVAALAPRPFFSNSPLSDSNFDVAGVRKATPVAQQVYDLLGAKDHLQVVHPDCGHDFPIPIRQQAYEFLDRHLQFKPTRMDVFEPEAPAP